MNVNRESRIFRWGGGVLIATLLLLPSARAANPDGDLRVEIITAYNLVVDSNAESPSTYAPKSAYIGAKFCNEGTDALTNVWAYIGNYDAGTPGIQWTDVGGLSGTTSYFYLYTSANSCGQEAP